MAGKTPPPKRRNRIVPLGDMIGNALDPALKRRGFASRDLIAHWQAIAPTPWDTIAMPDKLAWPRRDKPDPEGAVLHLRCQEGHGLALAHEGPAIASAVNRYFGYLLVSKVRLSAEPYHRPASPKPDAAAPLPGEVLERIDHALGSVQDPDLKQALGKLGDGVMRKSGKG